MRIELRSTVIRPWSVDDAANLQRHANNKRIWLNLRDAFPHPYTLNDARAFLELVARENPPVTFAIAVPAEAIGCIGLRMGSDVHRKSAELGFWLAEQYWGRGIMSEAVGKLVRHAFETFDLSRIYSESFASNPASVRVLEKAGFAFEGRLRANIFKDGRLLDSLLYARVRD